MLLFAVLKNHALKECNATAYGNSAAKKKMLNKKGLDTIFEFVRRYSIRKGWTVDEDWTTVYIKNLKRNVYKKLTEIKYDRKTLLKSKQHN